MHYIDLHRHIDGAITLPIARKLSALGDVPLPKDDAELDKMLRVSPDCTSLNEFLSCFSLPCSLMQTPETIAEAVRLVAENCEKERILYAELYFAPQLHTLQGLNQEEVLQAALKGLKRSPIRVNLVPCLMRGEGIRAQNEETLRLVEKYLVQDGGVTALNLAGAEALYPTKDYASLFQQAQKSGVPFSIHAGEAAGAESIWEALSFGAARIGHGVRAVEDPALVSLLRDRAIPLEMCPTSNRITQAWKKGTAYPLRYYLSNGLKVTINTDDPAIEGTSIEEEFAYITKEFGISLSEMYLLLENAVAAAFTADTVKEDIRRSIFSNFKI